MTDGGLQPGQAHMRNESCEDSPRSNLSEHIIVPHGVGGDLITMNDKKEEIINPKRDRKI